MEPPTFDSTVASAKDVLIDATFTMGVSGGQEMHTPASREKPQQGSDAGVRLGLRMLEISVSFICWK